MRIPSEKEYYARGFTDTSSISAWEISVYSHTNKEMVLNVPPFTTFKLEEAVQLLVALEKAILILNPDYKEY